MEILDNFLIDLIKDIPKTDLTNFFGLFKKVKIKKNEVYFSEGKQHFKIFYIKKGLLRGFYTDSKGEEKTIFFRWEKEFGADPDCLIHKKPARLTWIAVEDSDILEIDMLKFEELSKRNAALLKLRIVTNQKILYRLYERLESFIINTPEESFIQLQSTYHDLCERIPDKHLASFLGITPVSLSRIKKRLEN